MKPMKSIRDFASGIFIFCVGILTIISILGVWDFFTKDVISKSFETFGILGIVALIVIIASKFIGNETVPVIPVPNVFFSKIRNITLISLIVSAVVLAFVGVLSIWQVITDSTVVHRSVGSLVILIFSSLVIVLISLEREHSNLGIKLNIKKNFVVGIVLSIIFGYFLFIFVSLP